MKNLKNTKTLENLMKAFAGESQARMKYNYYASKAKKDGYVQISNIFNETADNEKEHAKRFLKHILEDESLSGVPIEINASYPVGLSNTKDNLGFAADGEHEEWEELYPAFADIAEKEGFKDIASTFRNIAKAEKAHENRYRKLLSNIENDKVFKKDKKVLWKCGNCGYIYEGEEAPAKCPACLHPQDYFEVFCENY